MERALKNVAEAGDINGLYSLIKQNHSILDGLDALQFDDTPLHIAARAGKADFAMEIANLKPSLAIKLNEDGLSPMHLALEKKHWSIARGLVRIDKEVVRVKGRGGRTPLHEVASIGNSDLLKVFLDACPASVEDTTVQLETALHLAVKSSKWKVFSLLLKSLERQNKKKILSWGDNQNNTVLHVATSENQDKFVTLLLSKKLQVNHINSDNQTALDILLERKGQGQELVPCFRRVGALEREEISSDKRGVQRAMAKVQRTIFSWKSIIYFQYNPYRDSPDSVRGALMVVLGLIATATYGSGITPPVDNWQHNFKPDHHNSTITNIFHGGRLAGGGPFGLSYRDFQFYGYLFLNSLGFYMSLGMLMILTMGFPLQVVLVFALLSMVGNYSYSLLSIAPQGRPILFFLFSLVLPILYTFCLLFLWELLAKHGAKLLWIYANRSIYEQDQEDVDEQQVIHVRDADSSVETPLLVTN